MVYCVTSALAASNACLNFFALRNSVVLLPRWAVPGSRSAQHRPNLRPEPHRQAPSLCGNRCGRGTRCLPLDLSVIRPDGMSEVRQIIAGFTLTDNACPNLSYPRYSVSGTVRPTAGQAIPILLGVAGYWHWTGVVEVSPPWSEMCPRTCLAHAMCVPELSTAMTMEGYISFRSGSPFWPS